MVGNFPQIKFCVRKLWYYKKHDGYNLGCLRWIFVMRRLDKLLYVICPHSWYSFSHLFVLVHLMLPLTLGLVQIERFITSLHCWPKLKRLSQNGQGCICIGISPDFKGIDGSYLKSLEPKITWTYTYLKCPYVIVILRIRLVVLSDILV